MIMAHEKVAQSDLLYKSKSNAKKLSVNRIFKAADRVRVSHFQSDACGASTSSATDVYAEAGLLHSKCMAHNVLDLRAPCGPRGCKNRATPFPDRR